MVNRHYPNMIIGFRTPRGGEEATAPADVLPEESGARPRASTETAVTCWHDRDTDTDPG
ncbi:hypothetical protein GCM10009605_48990 [Nocardiopsis composta]